MRRPAAAAPYRRGYRLGHGSCAGSPPLIVWHWPAPALDQRMRAGAVVEGTAFYDSLSFNDLWTRVPAR